MELNSIPGPQARQYIAEHVMPAVSGGLTEILQSLPNDPVRRLATYLREHHPKRTPPTKYSVELGGGTLDLQTKPTPLHDPEYNSIKGNLPTNLTKCGEYPVYGCHLPNQARLKHIHRYMVDEEHASRVHFVVVGAAELLFYLGEELVSGQPSAAMFQGGKVECDAQGFAIEAANVEQVLIDRLRDELVEKKKEKIAEDKRMGHRSFDRSTEVATAVEALREACIAEESFAYTVHRLQHPTNAMMTSEFCDQVAKICDLATEEIDSVVVFLTSDGRHALLKHTLAIASLYFRSLREVQYIRRLYNALDQQAASMNKVDVEAHTKALRERRERRDGDREALMQAHITKLIDTEEEEPVEEMIARDERNNARAIRRKIADDVRERIMLQEGSGAATRVQSFVRGLLSRKRNPMRRRVRETKEDFDELCRQGKFPMVECALQSLNEAFGDDFITNETPKRGGNKSTKVWNVNVTHIPAADDVDVSSEDEEWTCEVVERVSGDVSAAFNPFQDVRAVLEICGMDDIQYMHEIHMKMENLPTLQKKAMNVMERFVSYMLLSTYFGFKHKREESEQAEAGTNASFNLKIPASLQHCDSFAAFLASHREPLEWFANAPYALPLFSNTPQPVLSQRLLVANTGHNGAYFTETEGTLHHLAHQTPIFFVPDGLTADQWTSTAAAILKSHAKAKRLLWLNTRPDFSIFVNGVPFHLMQRHIGDPDENQLPVYSTIRNAEINVQTPLTPGGITSPLHANDSFGSMVFQTPLSPKMSMKSPSFKEIVDRQKEQLKASKVDPSWFGLLYEPLEQEVMLDLQATIDANEEGKLVYTGVNRAVKSASLTDMDLVFSDATKTKLHLSHVRVVKSKKKDVPKGSESRLGTPTNMDIPQANVSTSILAPLQSMAQNLAQTPTVAGLSPRNGEGPNLGAAQTNSTSINSRLIDPLANGGGKGKRGTRAHPGMKHQASISSQALDMEDPEQAPLPTKAAEALSTPLQTSETVKSRLRRVHGFDNALIYKRMPMLPTFGAEWATNVDLLYNSVRDALSDPTVFLAVSISSPESVFYGVLSSLVWAVEYCKNGALGRKAPSRLETPSMSKQVSQHGMKPGGSPTDRGTTGGGTASKLDTPLNADKPMSADSLSLNASVMEQNMSGVAPTINAEASFGANIPPLAAERAKPEVSPFPCVTRLIEALPRLDLQDSVVFVDLVLKQTNTAHVLFEVVEESMISAAAASHPVDAERHAVRATCQLERYITLLLFHAFLRVSQEQRLMMNTMQVGDNFSFKHFLATHQEVVSPFLETLDPWEGRHDIDCPVHMYSAATLGAHRWRRRQWMPNIN